MENDKLKRRLSDLNANVETLEIRLTDLNNKAQILNNNLVSIGEVLTGSLVVIKFLGIVVAVLLLLILWRVW
jgi:hypothetical protein